MNPHEKKIEDIEPGQPWDVDLFRPEDAEGVVKLFHTVYGDGYPVRTFIDPALLIEENRTGRTISSVARTPKGEIVGHNALFNSAPWDRLKESGAGLVHPLYRGGKGLFTKMIVHGQDVAAKKFGVQAIFGESVCNHLFSQRSTNSLGWIAAALEVDLMPAAAYSKEGSAAGRVSAVLTSKNLISRPHAVYLPERYAEALNFIYQGLDDPRELRVSTEAPPEADTEIGAKVYDFAQVARMTVSQVGRGFPATFDAEEKKALAQGVRVIQVWLKLTWPWVGRIVEELRGRGFFLGGVLPRWFDADGLLMQKLLDPPGWDAIQMELERSLKIKEMVKADWAGL